MRQLLKLIILLLAVMPFLNAADFPIALSYRKALTGDGYVVTMKNTSADSLRVKVAALGKSVEKVVDSSATWELGHKEGFTFAVGDKVSLTVGDKTLEQIIPQLPPISLSHRKAILGSSLVLVIQRNKEGPKDVKVVCERPSNGDKKTLSGKNWNSDNQIEYGHTDGWGFQKGDKVTVSGEGFETLISVIE